MQYFVNKGHEVHLVSFSPVQIEGIKVHSLNIHFFTFLPLPIRRILKLRCIPRIKRLIREIKPDVLHGHYISDYGFYAAASSFRPLILTAWGSDILVDSVKSWIARWQVKYALKKVDLITVDSKHVRNRVVLLGANFSKIREVQWGVDLENFTNKRANLYERKEFCDRLEIKNGPIILCPRGFEEVYNSDIIIKSIFKVLKEIPKLTFIFLGKGRNKEKIIKLAKSLNVGHATRFPGQIEHNEMPIFYRVADIVISIPSSDSTSVSLLEAMAYGCFPIVSDLPANREWIKDGKNGLLVNPRDSIDLSNAILSALNISSKSKKNAQEYNVRLISVEGDYRKNMDYIERLYYSLRKKS
ncbi:glycosyltransferase family 4 protein [candidate division WOR-3 bacterium]|nr:glycosyltransferase family 4 protein [candidate division WOR-3 bacterium]